jgi:hypothetical protein
MRTFTYEKPYFQIEVVATGILCGVVAAWCLWSVSKGSSLAALLLFVALVAVYQIWNTFVAIANPEVVTVDGHTVSFSAFGRTDSFNLKEVSDFRIREWPSSGKMYIRVGNSSLLKGRYWLQTKQMSDGKELFDTLRDLEFEFNPNSLKAEARRVNTAYLEKSDQMAAVRAAKKAEKRERGLAAAQALKAKLGKK